MAAAERCAHGPPLDSVIVATGTVDTALSEPFQKNVAPVRLFTPDYAAIRMLSVPDQVTLANSGKGFAWDGAEIQP